MLALQATLVLARSQTYDFGEREKQRKDRRLGLQDFGAAASKLAADLPQWRCWQWRTRRRVEGLEALGNPTK